MARISWKRLRGKPSGSHLIIGSFETPTETERGPLKGLCASNCALPQGVIGETSLPVVLRSRPVQTPEIWCGSNEANAPASSLASFGFQLVCAEAFEASAIAMPRIRTNPLNPFRILAPLLAGTASLDFATET